MLNLATTINTTCICAQANSRTHAITCLHTRVKKAYILAPGHELAHSYSTEEKVDKRMWKSIFIRGPDAPMCKLNTTKEATRRSGRTLWFLVLFCFGWCDALAFGYWLAGFRRRDFVLQWLQISLRPLLCSFATSCRYHPSHCPSHRSQAEEEGLEKPRQQQHTRACMHACKIALFTLFPQEINGTVRVRNHPKSVKSPGNHDI